MPILRDDDGNVYAIPRSELEKYKTDTPPDVEIKSPRDADDLELQSARPTAPHGWYAGD